MNSALTFCLALFCCLPFEFCFVLRPCTLFSLTINRTNDQFTNESYLLSSCSENEDIHAYVKEMTKEITAEIKSEIREVINQVEDVLENTEQVDLQTVMANISR